MNQAQLIENVDALRKQTEGLSWWQKLTLGRIVSTLKKKDYTQSEIDEFAKLYRQISDGWHKKTGDKLVVEKKPKLPLDVKFVRNQAFKMVNEDLARTYKENRLIFDGEKIKYIDRQKVITIDTPDVISVILWEKYNKTLSRIAGFAQASFTAIGITPEDVKEILLKLGK